MLNLNEEAICTSEELFALYFYDKYSNKKLWTEKELRRFVEEFRLMSEQDLDLNFTSSEKFYQRLLPYRENLDYTLLVRLTFLSFLELKNKEKVKIIIDKQIKYLFHLPQIIKIFPHAKFIILTRDVRDNIAAKAGRKMNLSDQPLFLASVWYYTYRNIQYLISQKANYKIVHYEDLIQNTEKTIQCVCEYLSLKYSHEMLNTRGVYEKFLESRKPFISERSYNRYKNLNSELSADINPEKIGIYKDKLQEADLSKINNLTSDLMIKLGYDHVDVVKSPLSIPDRIQKLKAWVYRPLLLNFYHLIPFSVKILIKKLRK